MFLWSLGLYPDKVCIVLLFLLFNLFVFINVIIVGYILYYINSRYMVHPAQQHSMMQMLYTPYRASMSGRLGVVIWINRPSTLRARGIGTDMDGSDAGGSFIAERMSFT